VAAPTGAAPAAASSAAAKPSASPESKPLEVFQAAGGTKMIRMEFYGLDIDFLLRLLSREAGVTIIKSEQVTGPITIIAPEPVPLDVAFQILNSVLGVRGFTMIRSATGIYKVVAVADAIQFGPPIGFGARPEDVPSSDAFITQVIPLENLDASDVASQIQGLVSPNANIIPTSTNSLIITDTAANIQRVLTIVSDTESQLSGGLRVFSLRYYDSQDMTDLVNSLILGRGGASAAPGGGRRMPYERRLTARPGQPQMARPGGASSAAGIGAGPEFCYPDTRTNSVILLATPIHTEQVQALIDQLDRPISLRDSFYVYPVQNLVASDLANKIGPMINAQVLTSTTGTAAGTGGSTLPGTAVGGRLGRGGGAYSGTTSGLGTTGRPRALGAASLESERPVRAAEMEAEPLSGISAKSAAPEPIVVAQAPDMAAPIPAQPQAMPPTLEIMAPGIEYAPSVPVSSVRQPMVNADDNTNTLLISASPEQLELVKQLLEQLDVAPPQVYIQAIIAEVALTRNTSLGFQWENLGRTFGQFQGNTYTGDISSNFGLPTVTKDAAGNVTGPTGFFGQISGDSFRAVLTALTTDSHARILSAPSIFTSNNQKAQIDVSSSRPFPRGSLTTTQGTGAAISTSIDYQSVGIVLTVTPRVTQGNMVQMEVTVSADEPGASVNVGGQDFPSVNRRQTSASLNIKDGNTIILGGLMRDTITRSSSRVPLLGDLPIIGSLFKSSRSNREKSELLVFLTPHVVRTSAEAAAVTDKVKQRSLEVPRSLQGPSDGSAPPGRK
jgi:general secretion pathway protein D